MVLLSPASRRQNRLLRLPNPRRHQYPASRNSRPTRSRVGSHASPLGTKEGTTMPAKAAMPAGLGSQSAGAHADDALITIAGLFTNVNFDLTIPAWDGSAYLKISNARGALTDLTIGSDGIITWEYRSTSGSYPDPAP